MAQLAGVSQSYVVALEGSRSSRGAAGPTPTLDVLARLASALGIEPSVLLGPSIHRAGPHVLLVVENDGAGLFGVVDSFVDDVDTWVSAGHRSEVPAPAITSRFTPRRW